MKLLDEWNISRWAIEQCLNGNDTEEIRNLITDSGWAAWYCLHIKDIPEIRKYITNKYVLRILKKNVEKIKIIDKYRIKGIYLNYIS